MNTPMKSGLLLAALSMISNAYGVSKPPAENPPPIGDPVIGGGGTFPIKRNAAYYAKMIPLNIGSVLERCEEDSLSTDGARGRFEWLKKHHKGLLVAYYNSVLGSSSGVTDDAKINDVELEWFFISGDRSRSKTRPNYLTFGTSDFKNPLQWYAPSSAAADFVDFPKDYITLGVCTSSCYTPDQKILFDEGEVAIGDAVSKFAAEKSLHDVFTLSDDSTFGSLSLQTRKVRNYTKSATETNHAIRIIQTASGGQLKVTPNHPLLQQDGMMVEAGTLSVGDKLVKADGDVDAIVSIEEATYFGRVYNLQPEADSNEGQIVIAQGFLSGSSWYQNDGNEYINRLILRRSVPASLFE